MFCFWTDQEGLAFDAETITIPPAKLKEFRDRLERLYGKESVKQIVASTEKNIDAPGWYMFGIYTLNEKQGNEDERG